MVGNKSEKNDVESYARHSSFLLVRSKRVMHIFDEFWCVLKKAGLSFIIICMYTNDIGTVQDS